MALRKRRRSDENFDVQKTASETYNEESGAQKNIEIGPKLLPIKLSETSWTTDATTARQVGTGINVAIYNSSSTLYGVRFGEANTITAGASGTVDANGKVSLPCAPNSWTYFASENDSWIISQNVALLVFIVKDHTNYRA